MNEFNLEAAMQRAKVHGGLPKHTSITALKELARLREETVRLQAANATLTSAHLEMDADWREKWDAEVVEVEAGKEVRAAMSRDNDRLITDRNQWKEAAHRYEKEADDERVEVKRLEADLVYSAECIKKLQAERDEWTAAALEREEILKKGEPLLAEGLAGIERLKRKLRDAKNVLHDINTIAWSRDLTDDSRREVLKEIKEKSWKAARAAMEPE